MDANGERVDGVPESWNSLVCHCTKPCGAQQETTIAVGDCEQFGNDAGSLVCDNPPITPTPVPDDDEARRERELADVVAAAEGGGDQGNQVDQGGQRDQDPGPVTPDGHEEL